MIPTTPLTTMQAKQRAREAEMAENWEQAAQLWDVVIATTLSIKTAMLARERFGLCKQNAKQAQKESTDEQTG